MEHQGRDFELVFWGERGREAFDHALTGFSLLGRHARLRCDDCHRSRQERAKARSSRPRRRSSRSRPSSSASRLRAGGGVESASRRRRAASSSPNSRPSREPALASFSDWMNISCATPKPLENTGVWCS